MTLLQVHIVAASAWLGVVAAESVMELSAKDIATLRTVARFHKWIDLLFEGPLVATVLVTGGILLAPLWQTASPLLMVKAAAGLIAVLANGVCFGWVQARARAEDEASVRSYTKRIAATGFAIPMGLLALAIGLYGV